MTSTRIQRKTTIARKPLPLAPYQISLRYVSLVVRSHVTTINHTRIERSGPGRYGPHDIITYTPYERDARSSPRGAVKIIAFSREIPIAQTRTIIIIIIPPLAGIELTRFVTGIFVARAGGVSIKGNLVGPRGPEERRAPNTRPSADRFR